MVSNDGFHPFSDFSEFEHSGLILGDSGSNPLLDLHLGSDLSSLEAQNHSQIMSHWTCSDPQDFYYNHYPSSRLSGDEDAWNPLQVTGVPNPAPLHHRNIPPIGDPNCHFSEHHYNTPSETESQYMSNYSVDSGFGSIGCTTDSVVTSSYGDSMSSPRIGVNECDFAESVPISEQSHIGDQPQFVQDLVDTSPHAMNTIFKCDHLTCTWVGKCPSDKRYSFEQCLPYSLLTG